MSDNIYARFRSVWRVLSRLLCMSVFFCGMAAARGSPIDIHAHEWKSIDSEHYEVIFPETLEAQGIYVSSVLEYLYPLQQDTIQPPRTWHFPVILNPDQMNPNGFVSILPRRSVYYTIPISSMTGDWLTTLAIHEGRHMFQFDAMNRNTVRALSFFIGEYAFATIMPTWWMEGDAVMAETTMTEGGRGRNPSFTAPFKALMLEDKHFGYNKMMLGSFRNTIPDPYTFGYLMQSYIRSEYDENAPETMFRQYSYAPIPVLAPFLAVQKATGKSPGAIYREMSAVYGDFWKKQIASLDITPVRVLSAGKKNGYTDYAYPCVLADGSVAASRYDDDRGYEIVHVRDEQETVLARAHALNSLGSGGPYLIWDELESDVKFDSSRTRIALLDLGTGKKRLLAASSRYISPTLSPDGSVAAMLEWNENMTGNFILMSVADGSVMKKILLPPDEYWDDFSFSPDGTSLLFVSTGVFSPAGDQGKSIARMHLESERVEILLDARFENVRSPVQSGSTILFVSNYSGIDTVYALDADGSEWQVIRRPLGAYFPKMSVGTDDLLFVDYADSSGTEISVASAPRESWVPIDEVTVIREEFYSAAAEAEIGKGKALPSRVPLTDATPKKYSFSLSGNRIDSWGILPGGESGVGVMAFMDIDNIASNANQEVSLDYDYVNSSVGASYTYLYRGFYPDFLIQAGNTIRDIDGDPYNETEGSVALEFPFGGGADGALRWSMTFGGAAGGRIRRGEAQLPLQAYAVAGISNYDSVFGVQAVYEFTPLTPAIQDHRFGTVTASFSGPFRFDGFSFALDYEKRGEDDAASSSYARGYLEFPGLETVKGSAEYTVPIFYPDFPIGALMYFDMISVNLFYDRLYALDSTVLQSSVGGELLFHFYPLQLSVRVDAGLRYSWQIENGVSRYELVILGIPLAGIER